MKGKNWPGWGSTEDKKREQVERDAIAVMSKLGVWESRPRGGQAGCLGRSGEILHATHAVRLGGFQG